MATKKSKKPSPQKGNAQSSSKAVSKPTGDLARLEQVLELMGRHDIAELEWEKSGERFHLKKPGAFVGGSTVYSAPQMMMAAPQIANSNAAQSATNAAAPAAAVPASGPHGLAANQKQITSPLVGTFYRSSSPSSDPYVKEGQTVKRGDAICIVEAMKLMNEIEAELSGKIISVLVENGQPVEFGEPLFVIEV